MATKLIKVGEYGYQPYFRLTTRTNDVIVETLDINRQRVDIRAFAFESSDHFVNYIEENSTCYYGSKASEWLFHTKEWKASFKKPQYTW